MLSNVQQKTIKPIIEEVVAKGSQVYTDEYDIYARLPAWGYKHQTVCHSAGEYARDEACPWPSSRGTAMASMQSTSTPWKGSDVRASRPHENSLILADECCPDPRSRRFDKPEAKRFSAPGVRTK
jgi:hypothetical protein